MTDSNHMLFYYRVSSTRQGVDGNALERYAQNAESLGIPESNRYKDVESGASYTREGFNRLCDRLKADKNITRLVVPAHSRLHRDLHIWTTLRQLLIKNEIELIDLYKGMEPVDIRSIATTVDAALAEEQRFINQRHAKEGHAYRRTLGKASTTAFGYTLDDDGFCVPNHAPYYDTGYTYWQAARFIVETYLELKTLSGTAKRLLEMWGKHTKHRDHPSSPSGIRFWLENPALRGHLVYFGYRQAKDKKKQMKRDNHTPLLTKSEQTAIAPMLKHPAPPRGAAHRLSKLVFCAECGKMLERRPVPMGGKVYEYLRCKGAYPQAGKPQVCKLRKLLHYEDVEKNIIKAITTQAEAIAQGTMEPNRKEEPPRIAELKVEIQQLLAISGTDALIAEKQREIAALRGESSDRAPKGVEAVKMATIQAAASDPAFWEGLTIAGRAEMYRGSLDSVRVFSDGTVDCEFRFRV